MELLIPDWPSLPPHIGALTTLRSGGYSQGVYAGSDGRGGLNLGSHVKDDALHVQQNRALLGRILPTAPVWLSQVHGIRVLDVTGADPAVVPAADACLATRSGSICSILTADCLPVLFCDAGGEVVAAAHAGWRGLADGVLESTLAAMRRAGAQEISAWLGPAIGPQCFEVGMEVRQIFMERNPLHGAAFQPLENRPGKYMADIYALARRVLTGAGVRAIFGGDLCTVSDAQRFYSYRRDRDTGRMATLIWIK
ncbi:peptidoglycan editing factor PgeF [Herbaspirillum sp. RTI4]|uniref:peptidoglycan editing factor PgeF n=1 Tax=Herbaspirillum sp. RTI4 TaxID=3048640 RepID=UPI002AB4C5F5|nr:peptidoglycan editing factor PgeF [Herbaspirillum sp. RTI4]MDY7578563.1 peptidoglycan editing factor PgeF [Herbaspirillum sp. RTI4]MEA9981131.1 peptidoglycan editing factor PgeF [Herbaspirillum sp. RTI4]